MTSDNRIPNPEDLLSELAECWQAIRLGADIAEVASVEASIREFGQRYLDRVFLPAEVASCSVDGRPDPARLAARFAAKEAVIKALDLTERGTSWREIEVRRSGSGRCYIRLHGSLVREQKFDQSLGFPVTLSHDGAYAIAIVAFPEAPCSGPAS